MLIWNTITNIILSNSHLSCYCNIQYSQSIQFYWWWLIFFLQVQQSDPTWSGQWSVLVATEPAQIGLMLLMCNYSNVLPNLNGWPSCICGEMTSACWSGLCYELSQQVISVWYLKRRLLFPMKIRLELDIIKIYVAFRYCLRSTGN